MMRTTYIYYMRIDAKYDDGSLLGSFCPPSLVPAFSLAAAVAYTYIISNGVATKQQHTEHKTHKTK